MKKTIIAATVLLPAAIAISSCSDDNDGPQATGMRLASIAADTGKLPDNNIIHATITVPILLLRCFHFGD